MLLKEFYLKALLFLLISLSCVNSYSQDVFYIHQNSSLEEIKNINTDWVKYKKPIYDGVNNGIYWFKITIEPSEDKILCIPESHISRASLYYNGKEIKKEENTRFVTFKLITDKEKKITFYLKVDCLLEARIPVEIKNIDVFNKTELNEFIGMGIYIGVVLCIILLNLIHFITFKNTTYLYYAFMVVGMSLNAFYKDGITALVFGIEGVNETHETTVNTIMAISAVFFSTSYLSLNRFLPRIKKAGVVAVFISIAFNVVYQMTHNFSFFIITDVFLLIAFDIFWIAGLLLWKRSVYARFFTIAYGIPLLLAHDYYISPHIGIYGLNLSLIYYKIGSVFEMIVFTYAIAHQAKEKGLENKKMRAKLFDYTQKLKEKDLDINKSVIATDKLISIYGFTISEIKILKKVADKKTNKEIATILFISENTVKSHMRKILQKLEVKNRRQASNKYLDFRNSK